MPKTPNFTPKAPIEKLPLAVRKDGKFPIRDNFESKRADFEAQITKLLGTDFKINYNVGAIWAYNQDDRSSAGYILSSYTEGFISALKYFLDKYASDGKDYFNAAVTQSELSIRVNTLNDKAPYISSEIQEGVYWIFFKPDCLGTNTGSLGDSLLAAVDTAPGFVFSLQAKHSIDETWEEEYEDLTQEIAELTGIPDVKLDPNFEDNFKALNVQTDKGWYTSFGAATLAYFKDGLKYQLGRAGFKGDEMLQEGLQEALTEKAFVLRVVPKTKKTYNEIILENGTLYLQTTVEYWYCNTSYIAEDVLDLL
ncbi:uncharacterized protein BT62DRAFT_1003222 [Guyanagaster necrorhizus]|uniref:Uncharacterized protein n=1 Tax=Guyanagaster necrorhizus TaxID=856835 RepID=A0A9P8AUH7_9AGAR|nr:uncharacterized protein BT62DRAFT_1003222 [Guyanagaster necrorhizus MCA 3950]KAG7448504.1 hypothetical protein BT62DRAFT_1003222 [Guyanagaster necrorhizus MCA 3950]